MNIRGSKKSDPMHNEIAQMKPIQESTPVFSRFTLYYRGEK